MFINATVYPPAKLNLRTVTTPVFPGNAADLPTGRKKKTERAFFLLLLPSKRIFARIRLKQDPVSVPASVRVVVCALGVLQEDVR